MASRAPPPEIEIVLLTTSSHDECSGRHLCLAIDSPVKIGRSSKTGARNVHPALDNAFIDSPVVSRDHALLTLNIDSFGDPAVFITDTNSMHGTYVDKHKLEANSPFRLHDGSKIQLGAAVYRNSETFPAPEFDVQIRPWLHSPNSVDIQGTFKVPDEESSEDESHESSAIDESDGESDSSGPAIHSLHQASTVGLEAMDPDGDDITTRQESAARSDISAPSPPTQDSQPNNVKEEGDDSLYEDYRPQTPQREVLILTPSPNPDPRVHSNEQQFGSAFNMIPVLVDSTQSPDPYSAPDMAFDEASSSDQDDPYELESLESCSELSTSSQEIQPQAIEGEGETRRSESMRAITEYGAVERGNAYVACHETVHNKVPPTDLLDCRSFAVESEQRPAGSPPVLNTSFSTATPTSDANFKILTSSIKSVDDVEGRRRVSQPMSLDRIIDSTSNEDTLSSNTGPPEFSRPPFGSRADTVTVESLLNLPSDISPGQRSNQRPWSLVPGVLPTQSAAPNWSSLHFEHLIEDSTLVSSNQFLQHPQGQAPQSYNTGNLFNADPSINTFDVSEIEGSPLAYFCGNGSISEGNNKETQKSKTSISISDIVDKSPASSHSISGQKRKADALEEEPENEAMESNDLLENQEERNITQPRDLSSSSLLTKPKASTVAQNSQPDVQLLPRHVKKVRLHARSALLGAVVGGVSVFAALAFLPDAMFQ